MEGAETVKRIMKKSHRLSILNINSFKSHLDITIQLELQRMECYFRGDAGSLASLVMAIQKITQSRHQSKTSSKFKFHKLHVVGNILWHSLLKAECFHGAMAKMVN